VGTAALGVVGVGVALGEWATWAWIGDSEEKKKERRREEKWRRRGNSLL
jgi:hypothetical protein